MKNIERQRAGVILLFCFVLLSSCSANRPNIEHYSANPDAEKLYSKGTKLMQTNHYKEAIPLLSEAIEHDPQFVAAFINRAYSHNGLKEYKDALDDAKAALRGNAESSYAFFQKAKAEEGLGNYLDAAKDYQEAAKCEPASSYGYSEFAARCLESGGKSDKAREIRTRLQAATDPDTCFGRGLSEYDQGKYVEAIKAFSQAIAKNDKFAQCYVQRGRCLSKLGQYRQALNDYNKAIVLDKNYIEAYYLRGVDKFCLSDYYGAAEDFRHHASINGVGSLHSTYNVIFSALAYRKINQSDYAKSLLQWWDKANSGDSSWPMPVVSFLLGQIGAEQLQANAKTDDLKTETNTYLGLVDSINGKTQEAIKHFSWVKEHGNKSFSEYQIAVSELAKLTESSGKKTSKNIAIPLAP